MVVMTNMVKEKTTNHMTNLTRVLYWSTTQGVGPSGRRHQASDILLQNLTSAQTEPVTETWL